LLQRREPACLSIENGRCSAQALSGGHALHWSDLRHWFSMSLVRVTHADRRDDGNIRVSTLRSLTLNAPAMRAFLLLSFLACCTFIGTAHAMSCMIHGDQGKAMLCYHKSADGRCMYYGPVCQTKIAPASMEKPLKPVVMQSTSALRKK
jgi:hypothetical protein